jgi:hypothetical protein
MALRRSSARLSGGSDGLEGGLRNGIGTGKKRVGDGEEGIGNEPDKKKRKTQVRWVSPDSDAKESGEGRVADVAFSVCRSRRSVRSFTNCDLYPD